MNNYVVYKHTLRNDGRVYIGQTCDVKNRWMPCKYKHSWYFYNAINKYGWNAFDHEVIMDGLTKDEADAYEIQLIKEYQATDKRYGFNLHCGGRARSGVDRPMYGKHLSEEVRKKISEANLGRRLSEETRKKISDARKGVPSPLKGTTFTEEHKRKIKESNRKLMKRVLCVETGTVYDSVHEAGRKTGADYRNISACCHGKIKTTGGYHWRFV